MRRRRAMANGKTSRIVIRGAGRFRRDMAQSPEMKPPPFVLPDDARFFDHASGFPKMRAAGIEAWLRDEVAPGDRRAAIYALSRRWLNRLIPALRTPHAISESTHFLLLSVPKVDQIKRVLLFLEETRRRVLQSLASACPPHDRPKHLVVVFGDHADYDRFTAAEAPEREREIADSGGMFIPHGIPHIVLPSSDLVAIHATLVHELVHDCVAHLPLPLWLNEGITQMLEYDIVSWRPFELDRDMKQKHAGHWTADSIQDFWSGRSFMLPGDVQKVSYNLSVVLVRKILSQHSAGRENFWEFVRCAEASDAGAASLGEHMGTALEDLVGDFLGPGDWAPRLPLADCEAKPLAAVALASAATALPQSA
jgi:hypothetical protein